jgi:hypothetical protein
MGLNWYYLRYEAEETDEKAIFCWKGHGFELEKHPSLQDKIEASLSTLPKNSKSTEASGGLLGRPSGLLVQSELEMEGVEILEQIIQQGLTVPLSLE